MAGWRQTIYQSKSFGQRRLAKRRTSQDQLVKVLSLLVVKSICVAHLQYLIHSIQEQNWTSDNCVCVRRGQKHVTWVRDFKQYLYISKKNINHGFTMVITLSVQIKLRLLIFRNIIFRNIISIFQKMLQHSRSSLLVEISLCTHIFMGLLLLPG